MGVLIVFFKLSVQNYFFVIYPILPSMNIATIDIFLNVPPKKKKNSTFFAICKLSTNNSL